MGLRDTKGFVLFGTLFTRILFIVHGGIIMIMFYEGEHIQSKWWSLTLFPLPASIFELLVVIFALHGREWKSWFCPSFLLYMLGVLPAIWLIELEKVEERTSSGNFDLESSHRVHVFGYKTTVTIPLRVWAIVLETSMIFILVLGRWIQPTRHLSDRQLANLWLIQSIMAADMLELLDLLQFSAAVEKSSFVYAILGVFSVSLLQFTFMIGSDKGEFNEDEGHAHNVVPKFGGYQMQTSLNANPTPEHIWQEILLLVSSMVLMNIPFGAVRLSAILFYDVIPHAGIFFLLKNAVVTVFCVFRILRLTVLRQEITINVVPPPN